MKNSFKHVLRLIKIGMGKQVPEQHYSDSEALTENRCAAPQLPASQNTYWLSSDKHFTKNEIC